MPRIIQAYRNPSVGDQGNQSVANAFSNVAQSMFGNQAQQEYIRQHARTQQLENQGLQGGYENLLPGGDTAQFPANAYLAGRNFGQTGLGFRENLANENAMNAARIAGENAREVYKFENTPEKDLYYQNGNQAPVVARSSATSGQYYGPPPNESQVKGRILRDSAYPPAQPQSATSSWAQSPLTQTATPSWQPPPQSGPAPQSGTLPGNNPLGMTVDDVRHMAGMQTFTPEQKLQLSREAQMRTENAQPLPEVPRDPQTGERIYTIPALQAAKTSGAKSILQHGWNQAVGFLGGGEVGSDFNRARTNLDLLTNDSQNLLNNIPGRQALQQSWWQRGVIPHPGVFGMTGANAGTERNDVMQWIDHARALYAAVQKDAADPATSGVQLQQMTQWLRKLRANIAQWEQVDASQQGLTASAGLAAQPGAAPTPSAAPPQGAAPPQAITPEQARAELQRRAAARSAEQARAQGRQ